jgi:hypothetical protein
MDNRSGWMWALVLSAVAIAVRFLPVETNLGCFGALSLFCGAVIKTPLGLMLPLAALAISDLLGHWFHVSDMGLYDYRTMGMVYLAYLATAVLGRWIPTHKPFQVAFGAVAGSVLFFLVSNFGAWLDPRMGYAPTLQGLADCYLMGIPFYRATFLSDLLMSGLFFGAFALATRNATSNASQTRTL